MSEPAEQTKDWIEKADHDLGSAKIIFIHLPDYFDTIAFHCQQAVERRASNSHCNITGIQDFCLCANWN